MKAMMANTIVAPRFPVTLEPPKNGICPQRLSPNMKKKIVNR